MGLFSDIGGAIGGLTGGLIGQNNQNIQNQKDRDLNRDQFNQSMAFADKQYNFSVGVHNDQMDLAKHGLRYRMEDAKQAGINPLAAMGMPVTGGSPVSVGGNAPQPNPAVSQSSGANLAVMGQSIARSIGAVADVIKSAKEQHVKKEPQKVTSEHPNAPDRDWETAGFG